MKYLIKQHSLDLACDDYIPAQYSDNIQFQLIKDSEYEGYSVAPFISYLEGGQYVTNILLIDEDLNFNLPLAAFMHTGYIELAFALTNGVENVQTTLLKLYVNASVGNVDIIPEEDPTWQQVVQSMISQALNLYALKTELFSGSYNDLSDLPSLFDGNYNSLINLPVLFSGSYNDLSDLPSLFDGNYNSLINLPALFSGNYSDLIDKPDIPANVSELINDSGFQTAAQVDEAISNTKMAGRNLMINSNFDIWQRGTSFSSGGYCADRFRAHGTTPYVISRQSNDSTDFNAKYVLQLDVQSGGIVNIVQRIENPNNVLYNKKSTLSFMVKSTITSTVNARIYNGTKALSSNYQAYNVSPTWTKIVLTFDAMTTWEVDDEIWVYLVASASEVQTLKFGQVKFEVGDTATEFLPKTYAEELRDCQRYYIRIGVDTYFTTGLVVGSTTARCSAEVIKGMRILPTPSFVGVRARDGGTTVDVTSIDIYGGIGGVYSFSVTTDSGLTTGRAIAILVDGGVSTNYCAFDAEL